MRRLSGSLKVEFEEVLVEPWSLYLAAVMIAMISTWLLVSGFYWGVFGGIRNWGDWVNVGLGFDGVLAIDARRLATPWMHHTSLMNVCLVVGSFAAALISRQFAIRTPPPQEMVTGALGGALMGIGATLAMGCNIGGFFNPTNASSLSGWAMWLGLAVGAYLGLKLVLWIAENITWGMASRYHDPVKPDELRIRAYVYPLLGAAVLLATLGWAVYWLESGQPDLVGRGALILCGFALGFVLHRSRFCFAKCFREPFVTGDGSQAKAVMLSLLVGILSFSLLFQKEIIDPFGAVPPAFWLGSLLGGMIFGVGMLLAGGCASGSLWRAGEGHVKLLIALFFFAWVGSIFSAVLKKVGWLTREMNLDLLEETALGFQAFLPQILGSWTLTYGLNFSFLVVWYLVIKYNEATQRFTVL